MNALTLMSALRSVGPLNKRDRFSKPDVQPTLLKTDWQGLQLPITDALNSLLAWRGALHSQAPKVAKPHLPQASLAQAATIAGCPARQVTLHDKTDVQALSLPTLLINATSHLSGQPPTHAYLLVKTTFRGVVIENAAGERCHVPYAVLWTSGDWQALDCHAPLAADGGFVKRVVQGLIHERQALLAVFLLSLMIGGLGALAPGLTWLVADVALPDGAPQWLSIAAIGVVLLSVHSLLFGWLRDALMRGIGIRLQAKVLIALYTHLLRLPYASLATRGVGGLAQVLHSADRIAALTLSTGLIPVIDLLMAAGYWIWIAALLPGAAMALLVVAIGVWLISLPLARWHAKLQGQEITAEARQQSYLHETLSGAAAIRVAGARQVCVSRWLERLINAQVLGLRRVRIGLWLDVVFDSAHQWAGAILLIWGAYHCLQGQMAVGVLLALVMMADGFMRAAVRLGQTAFQLYGAGAHLRTVDAVLKIAAEPLPISALYSPSNLACAMAVDCRGLGFRYDTQAPWILDHYDLQVPVGGQLSLRGASGAGKTTLLRLIAGLYAPSCGELRVFGQAPAEMRQSIAYLPQDTPLFEGTLGSNLSLIAGQPLNTIRDVARRTGLEDWISDLPMGYDTPVPSGGGNLSGGQRQLLALTAALATGRPLLLLDEALSHLDRLSQRHILDSGLFDGLTVIMITHEAPSEPTPCTPC